MPVSEKCPCRKKKRGQTLIQCNTCARWWHIQCVGLTGLKDTEIALLRSWECPLCLKLPHGVERENVTLTKTDIQGALQPLLDEIKIVKEKVMPTDKMKQIVTTTVEKGISDKLELQTNKWSHVLQENRDQTSQAITENNTRVINQVISQSRQQMDSDARERELRKCNVAINDFPESNFRLTTAKIQDDRDKAAQILGVDDEEIIKVRRAGKLIEGARRPRSLIVTLTTPDLANNLHDYGRGIKRVCTSDRSLAYWVNPDLIKADRDANYRARVIARQRRGVQPRGMTVLDNLSPISSAASGHHSRIGPPGVSPATSRSSRHNSADRRAQSLNSGPGSPAGRSSRRGSPARGRRGATPADEEDF